AVLAHPHHHPLGTRLDVDVGDVVDYRFADDVVDDLDQRVVVDGAGVFLFGLTAAADLLDHRPGQLVHVGAVAVEAGKQAGQGLFGGHRRLDLAAGDQL